MSKSRRNAQEQAYLKGRDKALQVCKGLSLAEINEEMRKSVARRTHAEMKKEEEKAFLLRCTRIKHDREVRAVLPGAPVRLNVGMFFNWPEARGCSCTLIKVKRKYALVDVEGLGEWDIPIHMVMPIEED